jgi:hypothetical protein
MQEELKIRTEKGEYSAMFTVIKEGAMAAKRDLDAENRRFMTVHGQVRTMQSVVYLCNVLNSVGGCSYVEAGLYLSTTTN